MKSIINRVQKHLDNNTPVEADDIQALIDMNDAKDDFIVAVLMDDDKLMIERFNNISKYYTTQKTNR